MKLLKYLGTSTSHTASQKKEGHYDVRTYYTNCLQYLYAIVRRGIVGRRTVSILPLTMVPMSITPSLLQLRFSYKC